jgi:uncharacterized protein (TIGR03437 family)
MRLLILGLCLLTALAQGQTLSSYTISTIAGSSAQGYLGDGGAATSAALDNPRGVTSDSVGNLYICDTLNDRIRKVSMNGTITTVAGTGIAGYTGDNIPGTSAELNVPSGVALDAAGNLYIADTGNHRVRKLTPNGTITTVAGNGYANYNGDGGPATSSSLNSPEDAVVDAAGNIYIADTGNDAIRKVSTTGIITTIAGNGNAGNSGNFGPATSALLNFPVGLTVDAKGDVFISDQGNDVVRKIDPTGVITPVAGNGVNGFSGDGQPGQAAALNGPAGLAVDAVGNLYIADVNNNRIRVLLANGNITTLAGNGGAGFGGDGGSATNAELNGPRGVSVGPFGDVYIADLGNNRIRHLTPLTPVVGPVFVTSVYNFGGAGLNLAPGMEVMIQGLGFGSSPTVTVGTEKAQVDPGSGPSQILAVIPVDLTQGSTTVTVNNGIQTSAPFPISLVTYAPVFLTVNGGTFFPTANNVNGGQNTTCSCSYGATNPVPLNAPVVALMTGLGTDMNLTPTVTVGGQAATGISTQFDSSVGGEYDVQFNVPGGLAPGPQPVLFSIGGVAAPAVNLVVGSALPSITGVRNSASGALETVSHAVAPNSIISVYAVNAGTATSSPAAYPTTSVEGVQVLFNGIPAPIYALVPSVNLINVQVPSELPTTGVATVTVQAASGASQSSTFALGPADVGIYRAGSPSDPNNGAILFANTDWYVMPASVAGYFGFTNCASLLVTQGCGQPAPRGQNVVVYWTGGGPPTPALPTGQVAPINGSTLYRTVPMPTVTIGGIAVAPSFSGIAPGTAGEYQINLTIPLNAPTGDEVPLTITLGNSSDTVNIAIQ